MMKKKPWIPILLIAVILAPFVLLVSVIVILFSWVSWGDEEPMKIAPYQSIAAQHGLIWQELLAIDLAKHEMDQDKLKPGDLEDDFVYYVQVERTTCTGEGEKQKCTTTTEKEKRTYSFSQVMDNLGFTQEQREMAEQARALLFEQYGTGSVGGGGSVDFAQNAIPSIYLSIYQRAGEKYGVPWELLAAIHRIETRFSTMDPMISYAGAEGHMQFMPCTFIGWAHPSCSGAGKGNFTSSEKTSLAMIRQYGGLGVDADGDNKADMWNITDAVFSASHMLARNGASSGDLERAILSYNRSSEYVADVLSFYNSYINGGYVLVEIPSPSSSGFLRPINGQMTSPFGPRTHPITGVPQTPHKGIDLACAKGDPIPASKSGTVIIARWQDASDPTKGYGQYVRIDHGDGYQTTYAHLSAILTSVGQSVSQGDIIGACGSTGGSTGNHLHFEIIENGIPINPAPFIGL